MKKEPTIKETKEFGKIVKVSDVKGFSEWLIGQTMPVVEGEKEPFNWAYYSDYERFIRGLKVID